MAIQITGIRKSGGAQNPHAAISDYQWVEDGTNKTDISPRKKVVGWVDNDIDAYVTNGTKIAYCYVRENQHGTRFLQTYADSTWTDNLLSLPEV